MERAKRSERLLVVALTAGLLLGFAVLAAPEYRFTGDTEHYVELARAIAQGQAYAVNGRPEVLVPPGLPLLLAPAARLFHDSFAAISRWAAALAAFVFPLTWLYLRRREPRLALPLALLTVGSIPFLTLATDNPMSEPVYLAVSLSVLLWADRAEAEANRASWGVIVLGCLLLVALPAVRTIGLAAVAAAGLILLLDWSGTVRRGERLQLRRALPFAVGVAFVTAWLLWCHLHAVSWYAGDLHGGYLNDITKLNPHDPDLGRAGAAQLATRGLRNLIIQVAHAGELLTPIRWVNPVWYTPFLALLLLGIAGWWQRFRNGAGDRFGACYALCFLGILILWPYDEGARFLLPLTPLLWIYLADGARRLIRAVREDSSAIRVSAAGCLVIAAGLLFVRFSESAGHFSRQDIASAAFWLVVGLAALLFWQPLVSLARNWVPRQLELVVALYVGVFLIGSAAQVGPLLVKRARGIPPEGPVAQALWEGARWIATNTGRDAVIQTTYHSRLNFATSRATVPLPLTAAPAPFLEIERRYHPGYVFVMESNDGYYVPSDSARLELLRSLFPSRLKVVYHFHGASIYRFQ